MRTPAHSSTTTFRGQLCSIGFLPAVYTTDCASLESEQGGCRGIRLICAFLGGDLRTTRLEIAVIARNECHKSSIYTCSLYTVHALSKRSNHSPSPVKLVVQRFLLLVARHDRKLPLRQILDHGIGEAVVVFDDLIRSRSQSQLPVDADVAEGGCLQDLDHRVVPARNNQTRGLVFCLKTRTSFYRVIAVDAKVRTGCRVVCVQALVTDPPASHRWWFVGFQGLAFMDSSEPVATVEKLRESTHSRVMRCDPVAKRKLAIEAVGRRLWAWRGATNTPYMCTHGTLLWSVVPQIGTSAVVAGPDNRLSHFDDQGKRTAIVTSTSTALITRLASSCPALEKHDEEKVASSEHTQKSREGNRQRRYVVETAGCPFGSSRNKCREVAGCSAALPVHPPPSRPRFLVLTWPTPNAQADGRSHLQRAVDKVRRSVVDVKGAVCRRGIEHHAQTEKRLTSVRRRWSRTPETRPQTEGSACPKQHCSMLGGRPEVRQSHRESKLSVICL
ncbi:hypothetical protein BJ546DRAFT_956919 [Cryomyces antarcticus]